MVEESLSYEMLLDQLYDGVYFVDHDGSITFWNKGAERITGFTRDQMIGKLADSKTLLHTDKDGAPLYNGQSPAMICIEKRSPLERELFLKKHDGGLAPVIARVSPILNSLGDAIGALGVFSDNSSKLNALQRIEELEEMALICPLTGVGNRRYAQLALENAMEELKRYNWAFGLLFADIDYFKNINDTYGHSIGDEVLRMVAHALRSTLRSFDFVGRWGGEEFMILLPNITDEILASVAERCRQAVQDSCYQSEGREIRVTVSLGAVIANPDESALDCIERADRLMYGSKAGGRNRVSYDS